MRWTTRTLLLIAAGGAPALWTSPWAAEEPSLGDPITISRIASPIAVDGELSDTGWKEAARVETWYETNPGDNLPPKVKSVGYLAYDDKFFYAAFEFSDPDPSQIRAPYGDRDNVPGYTDYGGVILDTRNDGRTGLLLLSNARGIQYDAVTDDVSGNEDSSPDFYWDSVARISKEGWILEMRVPFSSLRYPKEDPQTWGILLYRNYPRAFRYQIYSARLPRGGNCLICRSNKLSGLSGLASGGHLILAPYATASETGHPRGGPGTSFVNQPVDGDAGIDAKWTPSANTALDATVNPDFSQIESDVAQVSANERFALFFPEKRPFFLEGIELFSTPIQAVYTRTLTSPRWGARATGKLARTAYTALVAADRGGGSVILPGANGSSFADQDFHSTVFIGRVRSDLGRSFLSFLATDREIEGGGHNRVYGPDFQWRMGDSDTMTGQLLVSQSATPDRPDLAPEWTGQELASHAGDIWWSHSTSTFDLLAEYKDFGSEFRADNGFVPQVGFRSGYAESGYTFRPTGLLTRIRTFLITNYTAARNGDLISSEISSGAGMDGPRNFFGRFRLAFDRVRAGDRTLPRRQLLYIIQLSPSRSISQIVLNGVYGRGVDFANSRQGTGGDVNLAATVRPTNHLEIGFNGDRQWLDVGGEGGGRGRLFTADVERLRATYTFTARAFLRVIGQYVRTRLHPDLYTFPVPERSGGFTASALVSYKLNWQTVMFVGYGDDRSMTETGGLEKLDRQFFLKLSYAFQR